MISRRILLATAFLVLSVPVVRGGEAISNWAAPATWSPARGHGGVTTMDVTPPLPFIGLAPCRIVDTRGNGAPIQGGIFTGGSDVRSYVIPPICGVPAGVAAVSLNFTVTGPGQTTAGFLLAWPTGGAVPPVSILNWFTVPQQIANAAVVPTSVSGSITVNVSAPTHVIMDINGYYTSAAANQGNGFKVVNSGGSTVPAIWGETHGTSTGAAGVYGLAAAGTGETFGVHGVNNSDTDGSAAVLGNSFGSAGKTYGLFGNTSSTGAGSAGIWGQAYGTTGVTYGVQGLTGSTSNGAKGVYGQAYGTSGRTYGVYGVTSSAGAGSAGVSGVDASGDPGYVATAGVRGASTLYTGVLGISELRGVYGAHLSTAGAVLTDGRLGEDSTYGVYATGNIGATGTKPFIEPHPTDATKEIAYVSLEGPEAGTYFRGRGRIHNGTGVIPVPESFRLVSDEEGLTVQITPIGQIANVAVHAADLNTVVVRSSTKELEFYYLVNGVRKAFKDWEVITENKHYVPEGPTARMPGAFAPEQRRALIATGIYNEDETVNMETAERLGWAKSWADREALARTKARDAAKAPVSQK